MKPFSKIGSVAAIASAVFALAAPSAFPQDYPAREIRSLCNYGAGSGADIMVRFYSDRLSKLTGKPVIVENKVGANGAIASDALAKSKPDGYTILITPVSSTIVSAPYLFNNLPFDSTRDFTAVTTIATASAAPTESAVPMLGAGAGTVVAKRADFPGGIFLREGGRCGEREGSRGHHAGDS